MDETKLTEWEQLAEKATPGEWRQSSGELGYETYDILASGEYPNIGIATVIDARFSDYHNGTVALHRDVCNANAAFIAASREAVPELCKEVRRQAAEIELLKAGLGDLADSDNYEIVNKSHEWDFCDHNITFDADGYPCRPWVYARRILDGDA